VPDKVTPKLDTNGRVTYSVRKTTPQGSKTITLDWADMFHVRFFASDGLIGTSPIDYAAQSIGVALAADKWGAAFFGNSATPSGVLKHPGKLSPEAIERLANDWQATYSGAHNANKTAILYEGMEWSPISIKPEEAQFLETRKFQAETICGQIFRIPLHKIGLLDHATFSNIEHQGIEFATDSIRPRCCRLEAAINNQLIGVDEPDLYAEFCLDALYRGDLEARYRAYATGIQWGFLNRDEVRQRDNLNPIPDGQGKVFERPLNMQPIGTKPEKPEPTPAQEDDPSTEDKEDEAPA
jgi:HK97 family phage portal protein